MLPLQNKSPLIHDLTRVEILRLQSLWLLRSGWLVGRVFAWRDKIICNMQGFTPRIPSRNLWFRSRSRAFPKKECNDGWFAELDRLSGWPVGMDKFIKFGCQDLTTPWLYPFDSGGYALLHRLRSGWLYSLGFSQYILLLWKLIIYSTFLNPITLLYFYFNLQ